MKPTGPVQWKVAFVFALVLVAAFIWRDRLRPPREKSSDEAAAPGTANVVPTDTSSRQGEFAANTRAAQAESNASPASARVLATPTPVERSIIRHPLPPGVSSDSEAIDYDRHYILIHGNKAHPRRLLARFRADAVDPSHGALVQQHGFRIKAEYPLTPGSVLLESTRNASTDVASPGEAALRGEEMLARIKSLLATGQFVYVEPDFIQTLQEIPSDQGFGNGALWGLRNTGQDNGVSGADIDAVRAWDLTTGSADVVVAVVDTGIRYTHQDLRDNMWINPGEDGLDGQNRAKRTNGVDDDGDGYVDNVHGINAVSDTGDPMDDAGHGTHVAGTIGAVANGGGQHVGVAWNVRLLAGKAGDSRGRFAISDAKACIDFAVSRGARIVNASWGGTGFNQALLDSIVNARNRGVMVVAAAGNDGTDNDVLPHYPSNYVLDNVVAVAALDRQDKLASFSNYGATSVDVGAPGVQILSCYRGSDTDYRTLQGTSMAAPHVAGVAALVLARYPDLGLFELRQRLLSGAVPTLALRGKSVTGSRLNAFNAVNAVTDGSLEIAISPVNETPLVAGTSVSFFVDVTDLTAVTDATVTGLVAGQADIVFVNNGTAPDATANDHTYSATIGVPMSGTALSLQLQVTAPGKIASTTTYTFPIRQPPANDHFAGRTVIAGSSTTVTGSNMGATKETGEPLHAGNPGGRSVWWTWTAPANGVVTIKTDGSSFDTVLGAYTGSLGTLVRVASDDDSGSDYASLVSFSTTSGTAYQIAVDGFAGAFGDITLNLSFSNTPGAPANDNFAAAATLIGTNPVANGTNLGATKQASEPDHAGNGGGHSVWWRWTALASGSVTVATDDSTFDTLLAVYTGSAVSALTLVTSDNDSGEGPRSLVTFSVTSGTTYQIAVDGFGGAVGNIALSLSFSATAPVPGNDLFANRTVINGTNATVTGVNVGATKEAGEPDHANNSGGRSVWWTWTAPSAGSVTITTTGSDFDTLLAVYTGPSVATLTKTASNDQDPAGGNTSRLTFDATAGVAYQIAVDGNDTGLAIAAGNVTLNVALAGTISGPANDNFASRTTISGSSAIVTGSNVGATKEPGEPSHAGLFGGRSVWWTWTAPNNGPATIKTDGTTFDTVLGVYTGTAVSALTTIASDDDGGIGSASLVTFHATAGATYQIAVDGFIGASGGITLNVSLGAPLPAPANDNFASRTTLSGNATTVTGVSVSATKETGEPDHAGNPGGRSLWWTWTPTADGTATIVTSGSNFDTLLAIYTGTALTSLVHVASNDQDPVGGTTSRVSFTVTAGTAYQIAVDGFAGGSGNVTLTVIPPGEAPTQSEFFGSSGTFPTRFYRINPTNATVGQIGEHSLVSLFFGLEFRPDGILYGAASDLMKVSTTNGITTELGALPALIVSIAFSPDDKLYGVTNDGLTLYRLDPATGGALGSVPLTGTTFSSGGSFPGEINGIDFGPDGTLYGIGFGLYRINPETGVATRITPLGRSVTEDSDLLLDLDFGGDGQLRAMTFTFDDDPVKLFAIDRLTGVGQLVGALGTEINGLASLSIAAADPLPVIVAQPSSRSVGEGQSATFSLSVSNNPQPTFQWQVSTDNGATWTNLANGSPYSGVGTATLTVGAAPLSFNNHRYRCLLNNSGGSVASSAATLTVLVAPVFLTQPSSRTIAAGGNTTLSGVATGTSGYRWQRNGADITDATASTLVLTNLQPAGTGIYAVLALNSTINVASNSVIVGVSTSDKVIGTGQELQPVNITHPNGNIFDQVLLTGTAEAITADAGQVTRTSFIDVDNDIMQVEFSGPGTLALVLDGSSGPARPTNYNQAVDYMKGHAGIVITGANESTNVSVFTVGRLTAFDLTGGFNILLPVSPTNNPANNGSSLFQGHASTVYGGIAEIAFIAISSPTGRFGGIRVSNANFLATRGLTGIYAPGVEFTGPIYVGDISAMETATPVFAIGSSPDTRITGGDLFQANGRAIQVSGLTQLRFTAGGDSHGNTLPARINQARLEQNGVDVTAQIVVNPSP